MAELLMAIAALYHLDPLGRYWWTCGDLAWVSRIKISRFYLIGALYHCRPKP
ncbi:hypothetical protein KBT16_09225 [Nostoc sp. CCCryo 231-06]|nr:hypothetical protein [Nostoc sp. CCCryo 231-06]